MNKQEAVFDVRLYRIPFEKSNKFHNPVVANVTGKIIVWLERLGNLLAKLALFLTSILPSINLRSTDLLPAFIDYCSLFSFCLLSFDLLDAPSRREMEL